MSVIQDKAQAVANHVAPQPLGDVGSKGISPAFIQIIIQIITSLLSGASLCGGATPKRVASILNTPTLIHKRALRRTIRRQKGLEPSLEEPVFEGVLTVGATTTEEETSAMMKEAGLIS